MSEGRAIPMADPAWLKPAKGRGQPRGKDDAPRRGFTVGSIGLLLDAGAGGEVVDGAAVQRVPNAVSWLRGVVNLRGHLLPVFDLGELLLGEPAAGERLLVTGSGEHAAAFPIESVPQTVPVAKPGGDAPDLPDLVREHVTGVYRVGDRAWLEVDMPRFLESLHARIGD